MPINGKVLVIEDEPDGQVVVAKLLRYSNIETDAFGTGEDGLNALNNDNYKAAIIDLALPGMDGLQVIQQIRENPDTAQLPCIAITAYHTSAVKQQAIKAGFDAYFSKPIDDTTFIREINRIVGG